MPENSEKKAAASTQEEAVQSTLAARVESQIYQVKAEDITDLLPAAKRADLEAKARALEEELMREIGE